MTPQAQNRPVLSDAECVALLRLALPRLGLRYEGFRRVRRQVCRRVARRIRELGLAGADAYRARLDADPAEWPRLDAACRISISRCFRDRAVFAALERAVLPALAARARAAGRRTLRAWCAGCASGEEAFSVAALFASALAPLHPGLRLAIVATDADPRLLERARLGRFGASSVREAPRAALAAGFELRDGSWTAREAIRESIELRCQDLREEAPPGIFDLVLCRNLAFTYFEPEVQRAVLARLLARLRPGGALVVGLHESLPEGAEGFAPWPGARAVYRRARGSA